MIDIAALLKAIETASGPTVLIGMFVIVAYLWLQRRKVGAEAHKSDSDADSAIVNAASGLVKDLETRVSQLNAKVVAHEARIEKLEGELAAQRAANIELHADLARAKVLAEAAEKELKDSRRANELLATENVALRLRVSELEKGVAELERRVNDMVKASLESKTP